MPARADAPAPQTAPEAGARGGGDSADGDSVESEKLEMKGKRPFS